MFAAIRLPAARRFDAPIPSDAILDLEDFTEILVLDRRLRGAEGSVSLLHRASAASAERA
jgi:hypothetical protein